MLRIIKEEISRVKALYRSFTDWIRREEHLKYETKEVLDIWSRLVEEDNHDLIEKLRRVERKEGGYGTIVVPAEGFSKNSKTHQMVIDWLEARDTNIVRIGEFAI